MSFNDSFSFCQIPDLDLHNILSSSPHPNRSRHMTTLLVAFMFIEVENLRGTCSWDSLGRLVAIERLLNSTACLVLLMTMFIPS